MSGAIRTAQLILWKKWQRFKVNDEDPSLPGRVLF
jgi:hypothetical protein